MHSILSHESQPFAYAKPITLPQARTYLELRHQGVESWLQLPPWPKPEGERRGIEYQGAEDDDPCASASPRPNPEGL